MKIKALLLAAVLSISLFLQGQGTYSIDSITNNLDYNYFFNHVTYFASDQLEGRDVGSRGYNLAAALTANEFKINNLLPLGDDGTYFQKVPFIKAQLNNQSFKMTVDNEKNAIHGKFGENVSIFLNTNSEIFSVNSQLIYVGYGNVLEEDNIDDYKGIDVKDKVVIVSLGGPKGLSNPSANNPFTKIRNAADRGAKGIIAFYPDKDLFQGKIFKSFHEYLSAPRLFIDDSVLKKEFLGLDFVSFVKKDYLKSIFSASDLNLSKELKAMKKGEFVSKSMNLNITCSYELNFLPVACKNVIGLLPGSDSVLKHEYVVVGAHLDHLGVGKPVKGDSIYNGMWDNATGSATTISIAKTLKDANISTKRSIIFINYTAEEKGLFGSYYFVNSELVADLNIVANINIDMLGGIYETSDITPVGYTHSNISEAVDYAAEILDITISDATTSEKLYVQRSDQYSFIEKGVPFIWLEGGKNGIAPKFDVIEETMKWMNKKYHSPFDDLNQEYSDAAFYLALKANFLVTYYLANKIPVIKWKEDSWILKQFVETELNEY